MATATITTAPERRGPFSPGELLREAVNVPEPVPYTPEEQAAYEAYQEAYEAYEAALRQRAALEARLTKARETVFTTLGGAATADPELAREAAGLRAAATADLTEARDRLAEAQMAYNRAMQRRAQRLQAERAAAERAAAVEKPAEQGLLHWRGRLRQLLGD